jgi:UPF0755 protein
MQDEPTQRRTARHDRSEHPRRTKLIVLFVVFILLVGMAVVGANYYAGCNGPGPDTTHSVQFTVARGASASEVVGDLAGAKLINCGGFVGNLLMRGTGKAAALRAGTYTLHGGMSLDEIVGVLSTAPKSVPTTDVLVPPGYRIDPQIADTFQQALGIPAKGFVAAANSGSFSLEPYLPKGTSTVEGFLFPDTYRMPKNGQTPTDVITTLLNEFKLRTQDLPWSNATALGVTPYQVVVVASMIEKESGTEADRAKIAAVIYNRLKLGMSLGIDATVAYIDPDPSNGLTSSDFAIDSPYNTRLHPGLPPTPIASPGKASIEAALVPAHVSYLYFVACGASGASRFSTDYTKFLHDKAACIG